MWKAVEKTSVPRRTVLQAIAAAVAATPLARLRIFAQAPPITETETATLKAIAEVVLPAAVGREERDRVVAEFVAWVRNYKEGADMGHGYGASTLRSPSGPSPAPRYPSQFASLDDAAKAKGASSFATLRPDDRRAVIEAALNGPPQVTRLPSQPTGQSLVADFMGFYFTSSDAWDLAYQAQIGRDRCRTLDGSDKAPEPLTPRA
jgi:Gluconate 2-dehydrogenase subunit 3